MGHFQIQLSESEVTFIHSSLELPPLLKRKIGPGVLSLSIEEADRIRDLCAESLDTFGFDENYEPTETGAKLEALIDKFYTE